jgi:hypothetical protein
MPHLASMTKKPLELDSVPEVVVLQADIVDEAREAGVAAARVAWLNKSRSDFQYWQQCAELIKNEVEKAMGPTWHVIVGEHFGAYIAFEVKKCFYFSVGEMVRSLLPLVYTHTTGGRSTSLSLSLSSTRLYVTQHQSIAGAALCCVCFALDGSGRRRGRVHSLRVSPPPRCRKARAAPRGFACPCPDSFRTASHTTLVGKQNMRRTLAASVHGLT